MWVTNCKCENINHQISCTMMIFAFKDGQEQSTLQQTDVQSDDSALSAVSVLATSVGPVGKSSDTAWAL
jgi:hypothetical protein